MTSKDLFRAERAMLIFDRDQPIGDFIDTTTRSNLMEAREAVQIEITRIKNKKKYSKADKEDLKYLNNHLLPALETVLAYYSTPDQCKELGIKW